MLECHVSATYQGWTHTQKCGVCMWTRVSRHGAGCVVSVMVSACVRGPAGTGQCSGLGSTPRQGCRAAHPLLREVVQHHDVGVHVAGSSCRAGSARWSRRRAGALVQLMWLAVLGLIITLSKPCHLGRRRDPLRQAAAGRLPGKVVKASAPRPRSWGPRGLPEPHFSRDGGGHSSTPGCPSRVSKRHPEHRQQQ